MSQVYQKISNNLSKFGHFFEIIIFQDQNNHSEKICQDKNPVLSKNNEYKISMTKKWIVIYYII